MLGQGILSGRKTYLTGDMELMEAGRFIVDAILAVTIRDGVTAEVKKISPRHMMRALPIFWRFGFGRLREWGMEGTGGAIWPANSP